VIKIGRHITLYVKNERIYELAKKKAKSQGKSISDLFFEFLKKYVNHDNVDLKIRLLDEEKRDIFERFKKIYDEIREAKVDEYNYLAIAQKMKILRNLAEKLAQYELNENEIKIINKAIQKINKINKKISSIYK